MTPRLSYGGNYAHTQTHKYSKLNRVKTVSWRNISVFIYIMSVPHLPRRHFPKNQPCPTL